MRIVLLAATVVTIASFLLWVTFLGVWPVIGDVGGSSMEPNIHSNEQILFAQPTKVGPSARHSGVTTVNEGREIGYRSFGYYGEVIAFKNDDDTLILHRASFWVEEGENWLKKSNKSALPEQATCNSLSSCPAEKDGFITKGDGNELYDQVNGVSDIVETDNIVASGVMKVPAREIRLVSFSFLIVILLSGALSYLLSSGDSEE